MEPVLAVVEPGLALVEPVLAPREAHADKQRPSRLRVSVDLNACVCEVHRGEFKIMVVSGEYGVGFYQVDQRCRFRPLREMNYI